MDQDLGVDIMEIEHTGEDNSHAQESCRETEESTLVKGRVLPAASPVLAAWEHYGIWSGRQDRPHPMEGKLK